MKTRLNLTGPIKTEWTSTTYLQQAKKYWMTKEARDWLRDHRERSQVYGIPKDPHMIFNKAENAVLYKLTFL